MRRALAVPALGLLLALVCSGLAQAELASPCTRVSGGEQCGPGNNRQTPGGAGKVSHAGWPAIGGVFWKVLDTGDHDFQGGVASDELLGHHGSDTIHGRAGADILWGDWDPVANGTDQRDLLVGGPGDDFMYASHGFNRIEGGTGDDTIWAFYGRGTIDCGPGNDLLRVRDVNHYRIRNCERRRPFCAHGAKPGGRTCLRPGQPGAKP